MFRSVLLEVYYACLGPEDLLRDVYTGTWTLCVTNHSVQGFDRVEDITTRELTSTVGVESSLETAAMDAGQHSHPKP